MPSDSLAVRLLPLVGPGLSLSEHLEGLPLCPGGIELPG